MLPLFEKLCNEQQNKVIAIVKDALHHIGNSEEVRPKAAILNDDKSACEFMKYAMVENEEFPEGEMAEKGMSEESEKEKEVPEEKELEMDKSEMEESEKSMRGIEEESELLNVHLTGSLEEEGEEEIEELRLSLSEGEDEVVREAPALLSLFSFDGSEWSMDGNTIPSQMLETFLMHCGSDSGYLSDDYFFFRLKGGSETSWPGMGRYQNVLGFLIWIQAHSFTRACLLSKLIMVPIILHSLQGHSEMRKAIWPGQGLNQVEHVSLGRFFEVVP